MTRIGYARVSTGDQHPEAQEDRLRANGCELVFTDTGVSGSQARRPQWDKLLENLRAGDELACVKLDRIGRSVANLVEVVGALRAAEVELIVLDQNIDTRTPAGKLLFHMLAAIAEFERDLIIERTRDGQLAVRRRGNLRRSLGGTPVLGFRDGGPGADDWELDPEQARWLADAAARVLAGEPVEAVHAALGPMADATGRTVTAKMLRAALTRPASAGLISDGEAPANGMQIRVPAAIGGPLDEPTWQRLQLLFGARRRGRPAGGRYPLGSALRCANCGNQLTGERVKPYNPATGKRDGEPVDYYSCANAHRALGVTRPCRGCSVPAADVHLLVRDAVMAWASSPAARLAAARAPQTASRRAELDARIAGAQDQLADLIEKRMLGHIRPDLYARLEAVATAQIDADAAELAELDAIDAEPGVPVATGWDQMTPAEQLRTLAEALVTPIVVQPGNGGGAALTAADRITLVPRQPVERVLEYQAARRRPAGPPPHTWAAAPEALTVHAELR